MRQAGKRQAAINLFILRMLLRRRHSAYVDPELSVWHEGGMLRREHSQPHNKCHWIPEKVLSIPARAAFTLLCGSGHQRELSPRLLQGNPLVQLPAALPGDTGSRGACRREA